MGPFETIAASDEGRALSAGNFTPSRANRALVLVRRVVTDIITDYGTLGELRRERDDCGDNPSNRERLEELDSQIDQLVARLDARNRELLSIGAVLKDWRSGLVDFPAQYQGRRVWLCWRLGEDTITHWHELHEGVTGRRPIETGDFD